MIEVIGIGDEMGWEFFEPLFSIIIKVVQYCTCLIIGFSFVGIKLPRNTRTIVLLGLLAGLLDYSFHLLMGSTFILIVILILLMPLIKVFLKLPASQVISAILLALTFNLMVIQLLEYNLFHLLLNKSHVSTDIAINISLDVFIALNNVFFALIVYINAPQIFPDIIFENRIGSGEHSEGSYRVYLYFVIFILVLLNSGLYLMITELPFLRTHFRLFLTGWSLVVCLSLLFFLRNAINHKHDRIQFFLDKQYQKELLSFYSIIRSQRHDFNFHLTAIYGLIRKSAFTACKEYVEKMVKDAFEINELLPLFHPSIAAMLSTFKELAAKRGVKIQFYIMDDLRTLPCSVYEMNKILGNLIQNALDEYEYTGRGYKEDQIIEVEIKRERGNLVISVSNLALLTNDQLSNLFHIGYTTKPAHEGIGLPAIQKIIAKYNGVIYPETEEDLIRFIVRIPLPS